MNILNMNPKLILLTLAIIAAISTVSNAIYMQTQETRRIENAKIEDVEARKEADKKVFSAPIEHDWL